VDIGDLPTWLGALGAVLALVAALWIAKRQLREQRRLADVERTISFHRDLTTGEIGSGRDRLSEFMWRAGSQQGTNACWQPAWVELLGGKYLDLQGAADLSTYPEDMATGTGETPLRDLYKILWCFERIGAARDHGLLDDELAARILGNHAVWWEFLCHRVPQDSTRYRKNLADLAQHYRQLDPALETWAAKDFISPGQG
jgi:hypothetical protein